MTGDSARREAFDLESLRDSLAEALTVADGNPVAQAEAVLRCLGERQLIHYAPAGTLPLLTQAGRVLVLLARFPGITTREVGLRLGVTEQSIRRQVTFLSDAGLVKRTRLGRRLHYEIDYKALKNHPDSAHWSALLAGDFSTVASDNGDSAPRLAE
jgi:DNA-binding transcriptional ArsR family regulator